MDELKPCPFCGEKAYLHRNIDKTAYIECTKCECRKPGDRRCFYIDKLRAIEAWNTRTPSLIPISDSVKLKKENKRLKDSIKWVLGYSDFRARKEGEGAYWWRKELRERSGIDNVIVPKGEKK